MKKKILFIITKGDTGGAQKFVAQQIEVLHSTSKYELYLATNKEGWLSEQVNGKIKNKLIDKNIESRASLKYFWKLRQFITANSIHLIICNSANGGLYGRTATVGTPCNSIYVSHGWSSVYNGGSYAWLLNRIELALTYIGSSVMCISESDYYTARDIIKIPSRKLKLINNCMLPM